jgi:hypothetical protein
MAEMKGLTCLAKIFHLRSFFRYYVFLAKSEMSNDKMLKDKTPKDKRVEIQMLNSPDHSGHPPRMC